MFRRFQIILTILTLFGAACSTQATPTATAGSAPPPSATAAGTLDLSLAYVEGEGEYPAQGFGPQDFPPNVNPLTGLRVADAAILERRPVIVKVSNLPRNVRPQFGLSLADIVYEYYIEEGTTRFAAIFYSQDAARVGSIRSARFFDANLIRMYKGLFAFGGADPRVLARLEAAEFADRLFEEWEAVCPAMCRAADLDNMLLGDTAALSEYARDQGIPNGRQDLDGMFFQAQAPGGRSGGPGDLGEHVYVWYSAVIYNRWDYDPASGRYLRYADTDDAVGGQPEAYALLTDRLTAQPIAADNVVILLVPHTFFSVSPEMVEMTFEGSGKAYAFRDGQAYQVRWQRPTPDSVLYLTYEDGAPFPFKPGVTWFEVMGVSTRLSQDEAGWRFEMRFP